ncbi:hypothetical protein AAIG28_23225 [Citrobacter freundii]|nr:hypothetical protein [Citrobacter freundii]MDT7261830.1 hypothetical protein [Citrobacter freundii]WOR59850.1 hypothetical protein R4T23_21435 [Citrobacter freundii]
MSETIHNMVAEKLENAEPAMPVIPQSGYSLLSSHTGEYHLPLFL